MIKKILYLIIFFFNIISIIVASDCDIVAKALKHLKGDLEHQLSLYSNCCNYYKVIACDAGGQISKIYLNSYSNSEADYRSAIEALTEIESLTTLQISHTSSSHGVVIPESITKFKNLKILDLSDNNSGETATTIPDIIGNLSNLEELNLSSNKYIGTIPKSIFKLKKLKKLNLSNNNLSGTIPFEITELDKLEKIELNGNEELTGYVPLNSKIEQCNYSNTNLCYLKSTTCKESISKCTKEDIINTNKENGAPNNLTYENEVPTEMDFKKKVGIAGIFFFIMLVTIGYCGYKHRSKTYDSPICISINDINSNYNPAPFNDTIINNKPTPYNNTTINNIYNNYTVNNNSYYSEESPPPYYQNSQINHTSNTIPSEPPLQPSALYIPSAPEKY